MGPREWGKEELLVLTKDYSLKRIFMKAGSAGGLQYHYFKDEAGIVISGMLLVEYDPGDGKTLASKLVGPNDPFHFPTGSVHKAIALEDTVYIEASTPHFNDRCHVEHVYGLGDIDGGLPSTKPEDVRETP